MAAKYCIVSFFLASAIVIVASQVCTKMEPVIEVVTDKYPTPSIVTYSGFCQRSNDYYTDYNFGDYRDYEAEIKYPCTKSRWEIISLTKSRQIVTTKLVKYCCDGYRKVNTEPTLNTADIICEPITNETTTPNSTGSTTMRTWAIEDDEFNATDMLPEPEFNQTAKETLIEPIYPVNRTWDRIAIKPADKSFDPKLLETTMINATKITNHFGDLKGEDSAKPFNNSSWDPSAVQPANKSNPEVTQTTIKTSIETSNHSWYPKGDQPSKPHDSEISETTRRSSVEISTMPPWYVSLTTHSITSSTLVQTTAGGESNNSIGHASEISWIGQHWPYVLFIVLVIIVAVLSALAWRWTFIKIYLSGKYKVNANSANGNPCNKVARNGQTTSVDIPLNRN